MSDLIPYEKNPRKITAQKKQQLTDLVERYGLISVPIIDQDGTLVSGHQRLKTLLILGRGEEDIDVRVATRKMTTEEFKEVMVIENAKFGEWDTALLKEEFVDLLADFDFGIDFASLDAEVKQAAGVVSTAEMPIVAKYSEKYRQPSDSSNYTLSESPVRKPVFLFIARRRFFGRDDHNWFGWFAGLSLCY